jgi:DnaK suppressor protein
MSDAIDLKYFEKRLQDRLDEIVKGQERQKKEAATVELDQARVGRLTRMDAMQQQAMAQAAARLTEIERVRILGAQARMKEDEFGYCLSCGEEIALGRLKFDPSVATCIACAKEKEAGK